MTAATQNERRWLWLSYGYGLVVAAGVGYFLLRIPIQVTDSFTNMLALDHSWSDLLRDQFLQAGYLRPMLWAALKLVYDLADGNYFYWFRLTHVVQVFVLIVLFVRLLQPRSTAAVAVLPLSLAVLIGSHTFAWTVREAFPINTFLTIVLCCVAAANLSFAVHRWWIDVLACGLFAVATLTVESGLLVWVVLIGGYIIGLRGVSMAGIVGLCTLLAVYFGLRFLILDTGVPGLLEREAGFGFERRNGVTLVEMFGDNPLPFYAYNVVSSVLTVLVAEPRDGVWRLIRSIVRGTLEPPLMIGVVSSVVATALIGRFAWKRRHAWMSRTFDRPDQLVLLFLMVMAANATISFAYTKDVILSPAGVFFAAAVFVAARDFAESLHSTRWRVAAVAICLGVLSTAWAVRAVGLHAGLAWSSIKVREQWVYLDDWFGGFDARTASPRALMLRQQLHDDAAIRHPTPPRIRDEWTRLFEVE